jgi:hypothetical protein
MFVKRDLTFVIFLILFSLLSISCGRCLVKKSCTGDTQKFLDLQINNTTTIPSDIDRRALCLEASNIGDATKNLDVSGYTNFYTNYVHYKPDAPCTIVWAPDGKL